MDFTIKWGDKHYSNNYTNKHTITHCSVCDTGRPGWCEIIKRDLSLAWSILKATLGCQLLGNGVGEVESGGW